MIEKKKHRNDRTNLTIELSLFTLLLGCSLFFSSQSAAAPRGCAGAHFWKSQSHDLGAKPYLSKQIDFDKLGYPNVANFLEWIEDTSDPTNLCHGYYNEPDIITKYPFPPSFDEAPTTITANKPAFFSQYGKSTLSGDVTINQPGRQITADVATFYRDAATGKISSGFLFGNVHLREYGKIIVAKDGYWDGCTKSFTLNHGIYRAITPASSTQGESFNAWGRARQMVRDGEGILRFKKATYTTCAPTCNTWRVWGNKVVLNKHTGRGSATNSLLFIRNMPVFYLPYFNFPIDDRRKSGFLYFSPSFSSDSGLDISFPYYFNLAPNYDLLITPRIMSRRGILGEGLFRYLTHKSQGSLDLSYISNDNQFVQFQKDALKEYQPGYSLSRLENAEASRGYVAYNNETIFNEHWSSNININYVTDDYFFQDFGSASTMEEDQLLNQADIKYAGENWNFSALMQTFQTLHPINQAPATSDQYRRVPQLNLTGDFPNSAYGLDYQIQSEFVNFDYDHKYDLNNDQLKAVGGRLNLIPSVSLPFDWSGGYLVPKLQLHSTFYDLHDNLVVDNALRKEEGNISRVLPIFSADSGLIFTRNVNLFRNNYMQTLEPRVFYLFVPRHDQSDIPLFDSSLSAFSFDQLFVTNRFSGKDLVGDANQVSLGVTTRFLDGYTAEEKFHASIGEMFLMHKHEICIGNDCASDSLAQHNISPLVGELQYNFNPYWSVGANAAWEPNEQQFSNGAIGVTYSKGTNKIVSVGYNFVRHGDFVAGDASDNLDRINLSLALPITENWNLVGNWNYNVSHSHPQEYFYGIEYQSCCVAVRLVQDRTFVGTDENRNNTFKHAIYLQFLLKGLGSVGTSDANNILTTNIPGYHDNFKGIG